MLYDIDAPRQDRVRQRVLGIVKDEETAKNLQAWYPTWCKRPCVSFSQSAILSSLEANHWLPQFHDEYLQAFNSPNVKLVDTKGKGVDRITPDGIEFEGKLYDIDVLIWSTGFESGASPAGNADIKVTGRHGKDYEYEFANNIGTLHAVCSRDFPNMFWPGVRQGGGKFKLRRRRES